MKSILTLHKLYCNTYMGYTKNINVTEQSSFNGKVKYWELNNSRRNYSIYTIFTKRYFL